MSHDSHTPIAELDMLIHELAGNSLNKPLLRGRASSETIARNGFRPSRVLSHQELDWIQLNRRAEQGNPSRYCSWNHCQLTAVFIGQIGITLMSSIPFFDLLRLLLSPTFADPLLAFVLAGSILAIPIGLSLFDSYQSTFSSIHAIHTLEKEDIVEQIEPHSINGYPTSITSLPQQRKQMVIFSLLRALGSLYSPICYALTAANIYYTVLGSITASYFSFSLALLSFLIESQVNHSFYLLSYFVMQRAKGNKSSPNCLQRLWLSLGCWLAMHKRWFNGLHALVTLALALLIPHFIIESFDAFPLHLYWGGLAGLSASACLSQLDKNDYSIQLQNQKKAQLKKCPENTRRFFFDRPELALLWRFATTRRRRTVIFFLLLALTVIATPVLDLLFFSPSKSDYQADAGVFAFGVFLFIASLHSLLGHCKPGLRQQVIYSAWESTTLACSVSSIFTLIGELTDYDQDSRLFKILCFLGIYSLSTLIVTMRDLALNDVQSRHLFWQQPTELPNEPVYYSSDGSIYRRSKYRLNNEVGVGAALRRS